MYYNGEYYSDDDIEGIRLYDCLYREESGREQRFSYD